MPQAVSRPSTKPRIGTLNEVIPPIVPMGTTATRRFRWELVRVSSCCCQRRRSLLDRSTYDGRRPQA